MQWLYLFLIIAPLEWIAAGKKWHKVRFITKPLSLVALILWFNAIGGFHSSGWWFGAGLIFSLGGDVFLLLRRRFFIAGLLSFLIAHLCYITGFLQGELKLSWFIILPIAIVVMIGVAAYPRIIGGVRRRLEHRYLLIPVILYMLTITTMLFTAMLTWFRPEWNVWAATAASLGAILFTVSDSLLAAGRFLRPVPYGNFLVMFTYHMGQLGIITGVLLASGNIQIFKPIL
jgi:uncharacterized membrane protein YhhN